VNSPTGVTAFRLSVSCLDAIAGEVLDVDSVVGDYGSFEGVFPQIVAFADGWLRKWEIGDSTCELNATDGFKVLGNAKLNSTKYVSSALAFLPDVYYRLGETGAAGVVTNFKETVSGDTSAVSVIDTGTGPLCGVAGAIITDNDLAFSSLGQSSADTGHVQIPSGFSVQGNTHDFTVSFWVRSDRSVFTANAWWYGQGTLASPEQFHIGADASGNLVTHLSTGAGADNTIAGLYLFDLLPHMITFSHVHGSPGTTNVYTDGVLRATYSQTTPNLTAQTIRLLTVQGTNVAAEMEIDELMILKTVALGATDILALYNLGRFLYPQELSGARIGRILDLIGWPAGSTYRDVDTGSSEMALVTNAFIQENPLQYLQTVEDSEQGWFFMDRTGRPRWIARGNLYPSPITL
jgi:hypothetical protein